MIKKINYNKLLGKPDSLYEKFHDKTKIKKKSKELSRKLWPAEWTTVHYKTYPRMNEIILKKPKKFEKSFLEVIKSRKSKRDFSNYLLKLEEIASLLYFSCGENETVQGSTKRRYYPSPGGRYPLEVYLLVRKSEIEKGIYHYNIYKNSLEKIRGGKDLNFTNLVGQKWFSKASVLIAITAVFPRNTMKYGDRGYRHILIEVGCMIQNIYLISTALNLKCCGCGGYLDDAFNQFIDIDGVEEAIIGVVALGK